MVIFYKNWKKYNEIQLTKNKMDLNIRKMTNHPPSPAMQDLSGFVCTDNLTTICAIKITTNYHFSLISKSFFKHCLKISKIFETLCFSI